MQDPYTPISTRTNSAYVPRHAPDGVHKHELTALARCTKRTWARIAQKPTRTRTITCTCTGTVRSAGSSTYVAPNEALSYAHMLGTRERTRTLPLYVLGFTRAVQGPYTPISTRTNSAHVPRHAPNGVVRPVTVQHDHARAHAVSDRLGDRCRHERRFRPVSVQASSGGSAGGVTGPGLSNRPREGRPAPSPQGEMEGRIRPQRRSSGGPQARSPVARYVRRPDARLCTGQEHTHARATVRYKRGLRRG